MTAPSCPTDRSRRLVTTATELLGRRDLLPARRYPDRHHGDRGTVITQLNPRNLGPPVRATNEKLMVAFIQADLPSRVGLDMRKSIVLYDRNFRFNYALDGLPNERTLRTLYHQTPVRYWSKGV